MPDDLILRRCKEYVEATCLNQPHICACCGKGRFGEVLKYIEILFTCKALPRNLELLRLTDPFIVKHCIIQQMSSEFVFGHTLLDGLMLLKEGVRDGLDGKSAGFCTDCYNSLGRSELPKFSLKNGLYRGHLPKRFRDLTWVEEMIGSLYRNTAHVTRLFGSNKQEMNAQDVPRVLRGNTCAHETNVLSTAECLPRTPENINGMISVVFVGANKLRWVSRKRKIGIVITLTGPTSYSLTSESRVPIHRI